MKFTLTSPSLEGYDLLAIDQTCDGSETPPRFEWTHAPRQTRSFAMILDDLDAPNGPLCHWLVWDIPPYLDTQDPVELERVGVAGKNGFQANGYKGPCPRRKAGEHRYRFRLHALDLESLSLAPDAHRPRVEEAMRGHVLDTAELIARYARGPVIRGRSRRLRYDR